MSIDELLCEACEASYERKKAIPPVYVCKSIDEKIERLLKSKDYIVKTLNDVSDILNTLREKNIHFNLEDLWDREGLLWGCEEWDSENWKVICIDLLFEMKSYYHSLFEERFYHYNRYRCEKFEQDYDLISSAIKYAFKPYPVLREQIDSEKINFGYLEVIVFMCSSNIGEIGLQLTPLDAKWMIKRLTSVKDEFDLKLKSILDKPDLKVRLAELQEFKRDLEYLRGAFGLYSDLDGKIQTLENKIKELENNQPVCDEEGLTLEDLEEAMTHHPSSQNKLTK